MTPLEILVVMRSAGRLPGDVTVAKPELRGPSSAGAFIVLLAAPGCSEARVFAEAKRQLSPYEAVAVRDCLGLPR